nr:transposase [Rhodopirellula sp. JC639]
MVAGEATSDLHAAGGERRTGRFRQEKLTVHQLIRRGAERYVNEHRDGGASMTVQSVLAKTSLCRTAALGGRWYQCDDCDRLTKRHNSCGDRHCPQCSGGKRQNFSDKASKLILDGVDYYQVVFTLPEVLSTMALANRQEIAELLFHSAWKSLKKTVETEQQYELAALMVLHTWNQKLDAHWHVHALVPGAGPSLKDGGWIEATAPQVDGYEDDRQYLVDAINLRSSFRKIAVAHLQRLRKNGKLKLDGSLAYLQSDEAWEEMVDQLEAKEWVSYIEPPPTESSRGEHVVRYLTRYLTGGPISDYRIIAADDHEVTFWAREGRTTGGESIQVPFTLSTPEFVRRWCLHILPKELTKTRQFGGWSNTKAEGYLAKCRASLTDADRSQAGILDMLSDEVDSSEAEPESTLCCEHCGSESLRLTHEYEKRPWSEIFRRDSKDSPRWYRESQENDDIRFWDGAMGEGFSEWYAWYLKSGIESAREPTAPETAPESDANAGTRQLQLF